QSASRYKATPLVATRIEAIMSRMLTFRELKTEKGWPHSRQYTNQLVKRGKIPAPKKRPGGGSLNLWLESEWDQYQSKFASDLTLATMLANLLSTNSIDVIVAGVGKLRAAIEREGAVPSDIIVMLKKPAVHHDDRDAHDHDDHDANDAEAGTDQ